MRLLIDANLSPVVAVTLRDGEHHAEHVVGLGLHTASDETIFSVALDRQDVIVTADSDVPMMLATRGSSGPSVVLLRHVDGLRPLQQAALLLANLPQVLTALERGAVVSLSPRRLAVRDLPLA